MREMAKCGLSGSFLGGGENWGWLSGSERCGVLVEDRGGF